ncbi:serine/threonine-protein kinase [Rudaeicoccus suwonensis]|uniref:non-specific serine/threonine protein kinase n=1 Tax=Rudaeicoccus suwonensis TaxID=657409 RepID=A0A561EBC8_9MICO|nr:serine/threonine-protein kinase [Rudaeicoccus suwonensis]TWE12902.1 serine/threonine-protein kinase [Rudaeicoccus suwonensis]
MTAAEEAAQPAQMFGPYELGSVIGRGGMGRVIRARDTRLQRDVALKVMNHEVATDEGFRARFEREAKIVARLTDPHVIPIHGYGEIEGQLYLDMRLVEGRSLAELLTRGQLNVDRAVDIISQIADALDSAHREGLVHRDVKPSNILIDRIGFAYLVDFGIAASAGQRDLTQVGEIVGSAAYLAPERFDLGNHGDPSSDIYALTVVLFQVLTGSKPFPSTEITEVVSAHMSQQPPSVRSLRPDLPVGLDTVIRSGMAKDPSQRPATARALVDAAKHAIRETATARSTAPATAAQVRQPAHAQQPQTPPQATRAPVPPVPVAEQPRVAARHGSRAAQTAKSGTSQSLWLAAIVAVVICLVVILLAIVLH